MAMTRIYRDANVDRQLGKPPEVSKRPYFQATTRFVSSVVLGTALAFGVVGTTAAVLSPRAAMAQGEETQELGGRTLQVVKLKKTLAQMQEENKQDGIRLNESNLHGSRTSVYTYRVEEPKGTKFLITLDHNNVLRNNYEKKFDMIPAGYALGDPNAPTLTLDLSDFAKYVRDVFGREMTRVKVILKVGTTTDDQGQKVQYINPFVFPLDSEGEIITRLGNGQYVAFIATQMPGIFEGAIAVVSEPGNRDTLARK